MIQSVEDFKRICPILLYNFEIQNGYCELDDPKQLGSLEGSNIFFSYFLISHFYNIANNKSLVVWDVIDWYCYDLELGWSYSLAYYSQSIL